MSGMRRLLEEPERGDVPGWVLIAVMSAALVLAILVPFRDAVIPAMTAAVENVFTEADQP